MTEIPSWARKGAEFAAKQAATDAKNQGAGGGKFTPEFYLTDKEPEAIIRVLDFGEVVVVRTHNVQVKGYWKQLTCPGPSQCPLCDVDLYRGTRYVVNVIDRREVQRKGKVYKDQVKVWMMALSLFQTLSKVNDKYGCADYELEVSRTGKGKNVSYNIFPHDEKELSAEDENRKLIDLFKFLAPKSRAELEKFVPDDIDDGADDAQNDSGW